VFAEIRDFGCVADDKPANVVLREELLEGGARK
jgi:hypothetical protein